MGKKTSRKTKKTISKKKSVTTDRSAKKTKISIEKNDNANVLKPITFGTLFNAIHKGYQIDGGEEDKTHAKKLVKDYLRQSLSDTDGASDFNVIVFYDSRIMVKADADSVYNAVTSFSNKKPILLVLYSNGGEIGSAYLIGQLCREYANGKFAITVPRQAKSAATLLCCAADEIHMGSLSELGPIDPQINSLPALGLKNSIQHIANLVKETPESAEMFASYLNYSVKPIDLGYYERVAESAMQYAEKLLNFNQTKLPKTPNSIAYDLVYAYKDHGFVLDKNECKHIFGNHLIKIDTREYNIGNGVYNSLKLVKQVFSYFNYNFNLVGCIDSEPNIDKKK